MDHEISYTGKRSIDIKRLDKNQLYCNCRSLWWVWLSVHYARSFAIVHVLKSMEIWPRHSEMSVILQVSTVDGCPLSRVPLYIIITLLLYLSESKVNARRGL